MNDEISGSAIRALAYELWLAAGSPENHDDDFWDEARSKLKNRSEKKSNMGDEVAEKPFDDKDSKPTPPRPD